MSPEEQQVTKTVAVLGLAGFIAGLGTLLASNEKLTIRIVLGRAISSVALGVTSSITLLWYPDITIETKIAIACLIASLGTSGLERLYQKFWSRGQ
jgi:hypothetical protein